MTIEQLPLIRGLRSEEDVKAKIVIPRLKELGYTDSQLFFEVPIKAYLGRQSKVVYADIVVKEEEQAIIIIEVMISWPDSFFRFGVIDRRKLHYFESACSIVIKVFDFAVS